VTNLSSTIANSNLFRSTLAARNHEDQFGVERERLHNSLLTFRERAAHLANEIRKELPDLTVHDLTHLDALWEIASTITGEGYLLTPAEGFVLGGAILLHDLGMSVAATQGGYLGIKQDPRWSDLVTSEYPNGLRAESKPARDR
jgi:hypothetical protein